ncbi:hypothetical protein COO91_10194 (plasmid) [Nostoc flagelliforme CCNUN1]|uniref:Uncharacterized protein n=1 Tax=Nostoc flagelliforme CCNUN1 TaxID=2038116 RepID=A0A2K8T8K6_9NOSO|nr:hypothetical protein COO91_07835 [Nostoc flagelliforme CCNUN1]AUB43980.1 hypothetical protein COO91_10194 [Nostoc flagelliforme CCNUN1]
MIVIKFRHSHQYFPSRSFVVDITMRWESGGYPFFLLVLKQA